MRPVYSQNSLQYKPENPLPRRDGLFVCPAACAARNENLRMNQPILYRYSTTLQRCIKLFCLIAMLPASAAAHVTLEFDIKAEDDKSAIVGATVSLPEEGEGAVSDAKGRARVELHHMQAREVLVRTTHISFETREITLQLPANLTEGQTVKQEILLTRADVQTPEIQVVGRRRKRPQAENPVLVGETDYRLFESIQAASLAEGLAYQPGLRLENNCQNCGFSQVRLNGLDGAYSQILIDSRPVFSALNGVYGLEQIPPAMIERIDVIRGGGSAAQGANAIAGTINIITRDPVENTAQIATNTALINGEALDNTLSVNAALSSDIMPVGVHVFGFKRERGDWDANGDGYTETTRLSGSSFGLRSYYKPSDFSRVDLEFHSIEEFRRGGNLLERPAHQTDIAEQLDHRTFGASLNAETYADNNLLLAAYASLQSTHRESYYGGGGNSDNAAERARAANFYGNTDDLSAVSGAQAGRSMQWFGQSVNLALGVEWKYASVEDRMPGYDRLIKQDVTTLAAYSQLEWQMAELTTLQTGLRHDRIDLHGAYLFGEDLPFNTDRVFNVLSPRINILQRLNGEWSVRAGYARGFRVPQAFDEDLHIETVGGTAQVVMFGEDLRPERSDSFTASLNFRRNDLALTEWNATLEGFATFLHDPFVNEFTGRTLPQSGAKVTAKRNGAGATVAGLNFDLEHAFNTSLAAQIGGTLQIAEYNASGGEVVLEERNDEGLLLREIRSREILRTPQAYGFLSIMWTPDAQYDVAVTGVFTGPMWTPNERLITLVHTPAFMELNIRAARRFRFSTDLNLELALGVQNIFNSFQSDFETGPERDAGYVYGPTRPRSFFGGLKLLW